MKLPISVIVLTYNEEKNISDCLDSVKDSFSEIFIVDSYSTDSTLEIAKKYTDKIHQHPFENYSRQRNWALNSLQVSNNWVLNLDADHRITKELIQELEEFFSKEVPQDINGFLISRRTIFMNKWIKHGGHYPTYHANLFRLGHGKCEERLYDQHFLVEGKLKKMNGDIIDIITDSISKFVERHNRWAELEALELINKENADKKDMVKANARGHAIEKRRAMRNFYNSMPLFVRPFVYFFIRYFLRLGFLDGKEGLIFHYLQGFWYRFLIDTKIWEMRKASNE